MKDFKNCLTAQADGTMVQAVTGDAASTSYIDFGKADIKPTTGKMWLVVKSVAAFNTLTSMEINIETDSDSGFATALKQILKTQFALAQLTAGALLVNIPLPASHPQIVGLAALSSQTVEQGIQAIANYIFTRQPIFHIKTSSDKNSMFIDVVVTKNVRALHRPFVEVAMLVMQNAIEYRE